MISLLQPLSVGNAIRAFLAPPDGALWWRLLRRTSDAFTGVDDPGAVWVADDCTDNVVLDTIALTNGASYVYRLYSWDGAAFAVSDPASATPATTYGSGGPTPQDVVRDRIDLGMKAEVAAGRLAPDGGKVSVITAPFVLADNAVFPTITVHMDSTEPAERFLGENLFGAIGMDDGEVQETEGWLARWSLTVLGVSLNSAERIALREAVRRVVQANLAVFDDFGMVQIGFSQRDVEDTSSYAAPLYMTYGTLTCVAPTFVSDAVAPVVEVDVSVNLTVPDITIPPGPGPSLLGAQSVAAAIMEAGYQQ